MNDNIISKEMYDNYRRNSCYMVFLDKVKGKKLIDEYSIIEDCGVHFVKKLLDSDWGRSIVVTHDKYDMDFIKSKYLSDYFKENIRELLNGSMTDEVRNLLNGDNDINQMNENEIKLLNDAINEYYDNGGRTEKPNLSGYFLTYLYKLDGIGVASYIKNNIDGEDIARHILLTSGLNDRASFYSGRGVMSCDLSEDNLTEIFNKLLKLDSNYALCFIDMVCDMKTLGATEFINSFIRFGRNKFKYEKSINNESNISFDGVNNNERFGVAVGTILSSFGRRDDDYQISASRQMKKNFLFKIGCILMNMKIDRDIMDKYYSGWRNPYDYDKYPKRR